MDALVSADVLLFEGFRLDRRLGCLLNQDADSAWRPVAIGSRAFDVLAILADRQGALLSRDEIMAAAWPGTVVDDNNLAVQISALRRILDRDRAEGSCIQTIPGRGYRFVAPVTRSNSAAPPPALPPLDNGVDQHITADEQLQSWSGVPARPKGPPTQAPRRRPRRGMIAGVIGILLLVIATGFVGWHLRSPGFDEMPTAPRLSIVVLPFANLGDDPKQQYFADGVTEDLTTDLSRIADMLVISHDSAATYKARPTNAKQIGRELGVRYVLEGSVQRFGNTIRINAQLIDAETNMHLWAERFDRDMGGLFALQDEITHRIAGALDAELINAEASRPTEHPDALDYILRGRAAMTNGWTRENYARAIVFFEQALALDPHSIEAQSWLANRLAWGVLVGESKTAAADTVRADKLIEQVLASSPHNALAHFVKGQVLRIQQRCRAAIPEFEKAIARDSNFAAAYGNLGWCKFLTGAIEEVIPLEEQATRLNPLSPPFIGTLYSRIGLVHLLQSRTDEAIVSFKKALLPARTSKMFKEVHLELSSAYALKGDTEQAASELSAARGLSGDRTLSITLIKTQWDDPQLPPTIRALLDATYFAGLRKAGMPEK